MVVVVPIPWSFDCKYTVSLQLNVMYIELAIITKWLNLLLTGNVVYLAC
jgi:hypothetical protein